MLSYSWSTASGRKSSDGFIVQDLGFKYLRNRMMIAVDVDGLTPGGDRQDDAGVTAGLLPRRHLERDD